MSARLHDHEEQEEELTVFPVPPFIVAVLSRVDSSAEPFAPDGTVLAFGAILARLALATERIGRPTLLLQVLAIGTFGESTAEALTRHGAVLPLLAVLSALTGVAKGVCASFVLVVIVAKASLHRRQSPVQCIVSGDRVASYSVGCKCQSSEKESYSEFEPTNLLAFLGIEEVLCVGDELTGSQDDG